MAEKTEKQKQTTKMAHNLLEIWGVMIFFSFLYMHEVGEEHAA